MSPSREDLKPERGVGRRPRGKDCQVSSSCSKWSWLTARKRTWTIVLIPQGGQFCQLPEGALVVRTPDEGTVFTDMSFSRWPPEERTQPEPAGCLTHRNTGVPTCMALSLFVTQQWKTEVVVSIRLSCWKFIVHCGDPAALSTLDW